VTYSPLDSAREATRDVLLGVPEPSLTTARPSARVRLPGRLAFICLPPPGSSGGRGGLLLRVRISDSVDAVAGGDPYDLSK